MKTDTFAKTEEERRQTVRQAGWWVAAMFWFIQFVELIIVGVVEGRQTALALLLPRTFIVGSGMLLTLPIIEVAVRTWSRPFRDRLITTVGTALLMCVALVALNYAAFHLRRSSGATAFNAVEFVYSGFGWSWFFLGISGAVVGLSYSLEVRDRDRHLAAMELVARDARLATLHYQLNPHFLFNTLNSIAALIREGEPLPAETMTESLAEFLRVTLELDPIRMVRLSREIELQALYLAIEEVRFPDRLRYEFDVPDSVAGAAVPALILQPLVENAILHGVARSMDVVTLTVGARREDCWLHLSVVNDSPEASGPSASRAGVGLANVAGRLRVSFGDDQSFSMGREDGKYWVRLVMPFFPVAAP